MSNSECVPFWRQIASQVQRDRDATIARVNPPVSEPVERTPYNSLALCRELLSQREVELTEYRCEKLLELLATGNITSLELTTAFLRRAALAQKLSNCITELLPERALTRAEELDEYLKKEGKPVGPLHGLPISVKEHIAMKDLGLNEGLVSAVGHVATKDAQILQALWKAGAVFYARTTEPQTIMHLETSSNLYGVTTNPHNSNLTPGGSSGGEGALLALKGSCLGIGTDIGGSIRSPAANCGVYGFKPTSRRLSLRGIEPAGFDSIHGCVGPMSTSFGGLKVFMKTLLDSKPWMHDASLLPLPWRYSSNLSDKKLKVAVLWDDEIVKPHPPISRALRETVEKLKSAEQIELVDWKPYMHDYSWRLISSLYFPDGGQYERASINSSGEPWRPLSQFIVNENPHVKTLSVSELIEKSSDREAYRDDYSELWNSTATDVDEKGVPTGMVDVILSPVGPGVAPPFNCSRYWGYTSQWNLLDYPALVFPVSVVTKELDPWDKDYLPRNEQDSYNHQLYRLSEVGTYSNAPISLQLIGRRYEDEKVFEAFDVIKRCLNL